MRKKLSTTRLIVMVNSFSFGDNTLFVSDFYLCY